MALQKTNLFCTKQNNIANTTLDLPKYTCNNSVKTKITFRKILAVQSLVAQPFHPATFAITTRKETLFCIWVVDMNTRVCCSTTTCCIKSYVPYVLINNQANRANKFQQINSKPHTQQHQPVSKQTIQFESNFHDTTISVTCIIHQHDPLVEYKAVKQLHC